MIAKERIWEIREYEEHKAGCLAAELGISPLVTGILLERGMNDTESMRAFLYGSSTPFYDPFLMKDMARSVARIERALQNGEKITVYGDYDVDGITASSLLYIYLQNRGARVQTYIPQRKNEGYGLNDEALQTIANGGTTLVITVDCGISGLHEVEN
ncbi:MAG: DHH family phosphoesterase, partial [Phascolarctobacterium sp.]